MLAAFIRQLRSRGLHFSLRFASTGYRKVSTWKHFSAREVAHLNLELVRMLDKARDIAGIPFVITSGYRNPEQNANSGGVRNSAHEKGLAVDLRANTPEVRDKIEAALRAVGFVRIGVYTRHIHCDIDKTKPQVAWLGGQSHA